MGAFSAELEGDETLKEFVPLIFKREVNEMKIVRNGFFQVKDRNLEFKNHQMNKIGPKVLFAGFLPATHFAQ